MELTNETGLPARLVRTAIDDDRMAAALVARVTYRIEGSRLCPADEQIWEVSGSPWDGPEGPMPGDDVIHRGGVDLFIFGHARTPGRRPRPELAVAITVGDFQARILVVGDRVWTRRGVGLVASSPLPFTAMPLTIDRAFGGKGVWDGLEVPFPSNPEGRGYCLSPEEARGRALPNLEDPDHLVVRWEDQPDPVGTGLRPAAFGPHLKQSVTLDDRGRLTALHPTFFNAAFPGMIAPAARPGDRVTVHGVSPDAPVAFTLPAAPLIADLRIGGTQLQRPLAIDQIGVQSDAGRAFITYRYPFRYTVRAREIRHCALRFTADA